MDSYNYVVKTGIGHEHMCYTYEEALKIFYLHVDNGVEEVKLIHIKVMKEIGK